MKKSLFPLFLLAIMAVSSCRKDHIKYDVPSNYSFDNVDNASQIQLMTQLEEIYAYAASGLDSGMALDSVRLFAMHDNQGNPFSFAAAKGFDEFGLPQEIRAYLSPLAIASASNVPASAGVAGRGMSNDGQQTFLLTATGWDNAKLYENSIMGRLFAWEALHRVGSGLATTNGTLIQQWDAAFGYTGLPQSYPLSMETARFWGTKFADINALTKTNDSLVNALILGRAALAEEDFTTSEAQGALVKLLWEKGAAALAIHELNESKTHLGDEAVRNHEISECIGYLTGVGISPNSRISAAQIQSVKAAIGNDLYAVTLAGLDQARSILADAFGLGTVKDQL